MQTKYKVVGVLPGPIRYQGVAYDLRSLDEETAKRLAEDEGFRYLVKRERRQETTSKKDL